MISFIIRNDIKTCSGNQYYVIVMSWETTCININNALECGLLKYFHLSNMLTNSACATLKHPPFPQTLPKFVQSILGQIQFYKADRWDGLTYSDIEFCLSESN